MKLDALLGLEVRVPDKPLGETSVVQEQVTRETDQEAR